MSNKSAPVDVRERKRNLFTIKKNKMVLNAELARVVAPTPRGDVIIIANLKTNVHNMYKVKNKISR